MKILHILTGFEVGYPGGITNYVRSLASTQADAGDQVYVLDDREVRSWVRQEEGYWTRGANLTHYPNFGLSMHPGDQQFSELMALTGELQPEIIHVHMTMGFGDQVYRRFGELNVPWVVSLHDYYMCCPRFNLIDFSGTPCAGPERAKCETCIGKLDQVDVLHRLSRKTNVSLPRWPSGRVSKRNEAVVEFLSSASKVLAVSNKVQEIFAGFAPKADIKVLHIGNESAVTAPSVRSFERRKPLRLVVLGTLNSYKGANIVLELAKRVNREDLSLHFHGRVHGRKLAQSVASSALTDHGPYQPEELPYILQSADIGVVVPIWEDNAPQVVMELLNFGVPVLATRRGGIPDFVNERNGFLFEPDDAGIDSAVRWLESLSPAVLRSLSLSIEKLTTPTQHARDLKTEYLEACCPG